MIKIILAEIHSDFDFKLIVCGMWPVLRGGRFHDTEVILIILNCDISQIDSLLILRQVHWRKQPEFEEGVLGLLVS